MVSWLESLLSSDVGFGAGGDDTYIQITVRHPQIQELNEFDLDKESIGQR